MTLVVLTGATRGIGEAAAEALGKQGVDLALVGREPERVTAVRRPREVGNRHGRSKHSGTPRK